MKNTATFSAIILAAGNGTRYGKKKQFEILQGKEIWRWTYETVFPLFDDIVVVGIDLPGGQTRQESVNIGLKVTHGKYVVIFDAARPLVTREQVETIKATLTKGYKSVGYYLLSSDTIIMDDKRYLDRSRLKRLQVPQAFDREMLIDAHKRTKLKNVTDDCRLMQEVHDIDPFLILGDINLHKLTYPGDLAILEILYRQREGKSEKRKNV